MNIQPGTKVIITNDILVNNQVAFSKGEEVVVEDVSPNPQQPDYKYAVTSAKLGVRYQLRDVDVTLPGVPQQVQQQPLPPPASRKPKQKSGKGKWILLGVGLFVLLIIIVAVASGGKKEETTTSETTTTNGEATTEEATTEEAPKDGTHAVGETVNIDNLAITVHGFTWSTGGNEYEKPDPGRKFLVADIEVVNNDTKPRMLAQVYQTKVHTPEGYDYEVTLDYFPQPSLTSDEIAPGQTARGNVCFDVPENIGPCSIIIDTDMIIGDSFEVKLQ